MVLASMSSSEASSSSFGLGSSPSNCSISSTEPRSSRGAWAMMSICRSSKAGLDCTHRCDGSGGSISECSPHPWSTDTTRPSSGLHLLAHTPNSRFSSPFRGMKKPQVEQGLPSAVLVDSDFGPRGPSYQRLAVCARPKGVNTCLRDSSNSSTASSTSSLDVSDVSDISGVSAGAPSPASVARKPSSRRGSSGSVPMESVTARSVGSRRSFQGIHAGGRNALSVGTNDDSLTVQ